MLIRVSTLLLIWVLALLLTSVVAIGIVLVSLLLSIVTPLVMLLTIRLLIVSAPRAAPLPTEVIITGVASASRLPLLPLALIREHVVGIVDALELGLSLAICFVRVILLGLLVVCNLDLFLCRCLAHPECLIVVLPWVKVSVT